ncbi:MAG: hypothetical protein P4L84_28290 [Isosphaeraceae bacterium]|nr:hypothetical protein [Isosphaeraceae bacterium]
MTTRSAHWAVLGFGLALTACAGCGTVKTSGTARTGTEQLLLTNAWDSALQKVDFRPLTGVPVYLDVTNVSAVDQGWVVSSIRQAMLSQGVLLRAKPEQAQWIVEARVGAYGTDNYNWLLGIPQTTIPQTVTGMPAGTIPEMAVIKKNDQQGIAKLALFGYDRSSGQLVWNSGTMMATATAKDVYFGGVGPIQSGTIHGGTNVVGIKIPLSAETINQNESAGARSAPPFSDPALKISPAGADVDSFAP